MSSKNKLPPVTINPTHGVVGQSELVLLDGENTYSISLDGLFKIAGMPILLTLYNEWRHRQDPAVMERINATKTKGGR